MLISKTDQALLATHHVQIDIQDKCGLMTIQGRQYTITLLTPTSEGKTHPLTYQPKELSKEQMMNTASKVAIILLKKELLQNVSSEPVSFEIDQQRIKAVDALSKKIIDHEDAEIGKNTRLDYNALMDYLFPNHTGKEEGIDEGEDAIDENLINNNGAMTEHEGSSTQITTSEERLLGKEMGTEPKKKGKVKKKKVGLYDVSRNKTKMTPPLNSSFQSTPFKKAFKIKKELIKRPAIRAKHIKTEKGLSRVGKKPNILTKKTREKTSSLFLNTHQWVLAKSPSQFNPSSALIAPPELEHRNETTVHELLRTTSMDADADISPVTDDHPMQEEMVQEETVIPRTDLEDKNVELVVKKSEKKKEKMSMDLVARDESSASRALVKSFPRSLGMLKPPFFYPFIKSPPFFLPLTFKTYLTSSLGISPVIQMAKAMKKGFLPFLDPKRMIAAPPTSLKKQESALTLLQENDEDFTRELLNGWKETQPDRRKQIKTLTGDLTSIVGSNHDSQYLPLQTYSFPIKNRFIAPALANQGNIPGGIGTFALVTVAVNLIKMFRRGFR